VKIGFISDSVKTQYAGINTFSRNMEEVLLDLCELIKPLNFVTQNSNNNWSYFSQVQRYFNAFVLFPRVFQHEEVNVVVEPAHFGPFNLPKSIKRVTVIHDLTPIINPSWHPFASVLAHKLLLKRILRKADLIVTNSEFTKSDITRYYPWVRNKVKAIHLGVASEFRRVTNKEKLADVGIHKDYILYLGTIEPRKNLKNLIIAYNRMRDNTPDRSVQLILAGKEGWKTRDIMRERKNSPYIDDIILLGYVDRHLIPSLKALVYQC